MYALRNLRNVAGEQSAILAYHGYVASVLRYGIIIWGNCTDVTQVFIVQKKCVRALCGVSPIEPCRPLFQRLGLLTLTGLYIYEIAAFVRHNPNFFTKLEQVPRLRGRDLTCLKMPSSKTALFKKNCFAMTIKVYNSLPFQLRQLPNKYFLSKLKQWLNQKCFYTLNEFFNHSAL